MLPLLRTGGAHRAAALICAASILGACSSAGTGPVPQMPQSQPVAPASTGATVNAAVNAADYAAATQISNLKIHIDRIRPMHGSTTKSTSFPFDMTTHGGARIASATQHLLFVNAPGTTWGAPRTFLTDANANMAVSAAYYHMLDQYVGSALNNRYPMAASDVNVGIPVFPDTSGVVMLSEGDIIGGVHAALVALALTNPNYTHVFHVFLPPGVDTCLDFTTQCYSPNNLATFAFCGYHGSVTFADRGHTIFTVEPFQGSPASPICYPSTVSLANATDSTLSHEFFESASDPDLNAFFNDLTGFEIGDACTPSTVVPSANLTLNAHAYVVQKEYSNAVHGCGP